MPEYSPAFKARVVRRLVGPQAVSESQLAEAVGVPQTTLSRWVREVEDVRPTHAEEDRLKVLERENRELRRANEILRKARVDSMGQCNTLFYHPLRGVTWRRSVVPGSRRTSGSRSGRCGRPATPAR